jgi:ring-1,2-phenylacetyl-CoA epoxidase subunit PaaD
MIALTGIEDHVASILASVPDPEIPAVSIVDLGIVRAVGTEQGRVWVSLTPTYTGCPATAAIEQATRQALDGAGLGEVEIRLVLSPAWSTEMITAEGHDKLKAYGIAPPEPGSQPAACPRCNSRNTREVSRFGSTPCKAIWQCKACLEPFDRFKCH